MKRILFVLFIFFISYSSHAQKIKGQWRGYFDSKGDIVLSGSDNTEYVLEIEVNGSKINGYSYTYFQDRKYYTICSLSGTYDPEEKTLIVTETARIKGFTPPDWSDCLQTHLLTYQKIGQKEELIGKWRTAVGQLGDCGFGSTTLTRRTLSKSLAIYNKSQNRTPVSKPKPVVKAPELASRPKAVPPVTKKTLPAKPAITAPSLVKNDPVIKDNVNDIPPVIKKEPSISAKTEINFEKRDNKVLRTIEIENETFKVDLYDNGDVDGDSVSLFYNGKLLLSHKRLSEKPITLLLDATTGKDTNELTMYAENLGTIPPNTALMVVTDGDNRYEVRIASDLEKSGAIRFVHKLKHGP